MLDYWEYTSWASLLEAQYIAATRFSFIEVKLVAAWTKLHRCNRMTIWAVFEP
jgi:hypothetical protein